jgi:hypothetical protein
VPSVREEGDTTILPVVEDNCGRRASADPQGRGSYPACPGHGAPSGDRNGATAGCRDHPH